MKKSASPAKLRSGAWGARVAGEVQSGDVVQITTRSGKTWDAQVVKVVWTGDGISLCETRSMDPPRNWNGRYGCHTGGDCSSVCNPATCPCGDGGWYTCC